MARTHHFFSRLSSFSERSAAENDEANELPTANPSGASLEGQIVGVVDGAIVGWAWDATRPYDPVDIELYADGVVLARAKADHFDLDLAKANRGNGLHRFEARLDRLPDSPPPFVVRCVIAGTERELHPSITVTTLEQAESLLAGGEYLGRVAGIENGMLCGWVYNRRNPHELPTLTLRIGGKAALSLPAGDQVVMAIDQGTTAPVFRFKLPLPATLLDGQLHALSVSAGNSDRDLTGSPVLFGPSDIGSIARGLVLAADRVARIERRLDALPIPADVASYEGGIISRLLTRVDTLLNIHRDSIEGELAVVRRQLTDILQRVPEGNPDVIEPAQSVPAIEDIQLQPETSFMALGRSAPLLSYELGQPTAVAKLSGALSWPKRGKPSGIIIAGNGRVELEKSFDAKVSVLLSGTGGQDRSEFQGLILLVNGSPMSGRFDVADNGDWTFIGTQIDNAGDGATRGLSIEYLSDVSQPSGNLTLNRLTVFGAGRVPEHIANMLPESVTIGLGGENTGHGWYPAESGRRGGFCWMGEDGVLALRIRQSGFYRVTIPEIRPLSAEIMPSMRLFLGETPLQVEVSAPTRDSTSYRATASGSLAIVKDRDVQLRIHFPKDAVKSPMQLGLNNDLRPLSIAVRCVVLDAIDPAENAEKSN